MTLLRTNSLRHQLGWPVADGLGRVPGRRRSLLGVRRRSAAAGWLALVAFEACTFVATVTFVAGLRVQDFSGPGPLLAAAPAPAPTYDRQAPQTTTEASADRAPTEAGAPALPGPLLPPAPVAQH